MPGCIAERDLRWRGYSWSWPVRRRRRVKDRNSLFSPPFCLLRRRRRRTRTTRSSGSEHSSSSTASRRTSTRSSRPPGYKIEVMPFESPTDGKNAVLTGTVDTCIHGIAAFLLGAAAGEPIVIVAGATNRGMAIDRRRQVRHQDDQGSQGQARRDLPGLDAGGRDPRAAQGGRPVGQATSSRSGCRSATCRRRSRAATSTLMSAPNPDPESASRTASAGSSNTPTRRRSARST